MDAKPSCPWGLQICQWIMDSDHGARASNQARLRQLKHDQACGVSIFSSHDTAELKALQAPAT